MSLLMSIDKHVWQKIVLHIIIVTALPPNCVSYWTATRRYMLQVLLDNEGVIGDVGRGRCTGFTVGLGQHPVMVNDFMD